MTSEPGSQGVCKRPGCGNPLPPSGRGRARQFCSPGCARRYHNAARVPAHVAMPVDGGDPVAALEALVRHATVLVRTVREQTTSLDPARVRAEVAEAQAARARAEASAAAANARAEEAISEIEALAESIEELRAERDESLASLRREREELDRVRADATRERDMLRGYYQAQLDSLTELSRAERTRAERAEAHLDSLRAISVKTGSTG